MISSMPAIAPTAGTKRLTPSMSVTTPAEFVDRQQASEKQNAVGDRSACSSGNPSCSHVERGRVEHINESEIDASYRKGMLP